MKPGRIHVGIGGWSYAPWRETFYPPHVPRGRELEYASRELSAIEVNGTFHRAQSPDTFAKWHAATPERFVFSLKAPRHATYRKALGDAREAIERFVGSGIARLQRKLGPILWQLEPRHAFEPRDLEAFLALLPPEAEGCLLRHVLEVGHESFASPEFIGLARRYRTGLVLTDAPDHPSFTALTAGFVYARLKRSQATLPAGYPEADLEEWAARARAWTAGGTDVFVFFIGAAKERNPAAARALLSKLAKLGSESN